MNSPAGSGYDLSHSVTEPIVAGSQDFVHASFQQSAEIGRESFRMAAEQGQQAIKAGAMTAFQGGMAVGSLINRVGSAQSGQQDDEGGHGDVLAASSRGTMMVHQGANTATQTTMIQVRGQQRIVESSVATSVQAASKTATTLVSNSIRGATTVATQSSRVLVQRATEAGVMATQAAATAATTAATTATTTAATAATTATATAATTAASTAAATAASAAATTTATAASAAVSGAASAAAGAATTAVSGAVSAATSAVTTAAGAVTSVITSAVSAAFSAIAAAVITVLVMIGLLVGTGYALVSMQNNSVPAAAAASRHDDYPYPDNFGQGMSPMGYAYGNCTDFVAWRINRDQGSYGEPWSYTWGDLTPLGGDGKDWGLPGNMPGWEVTTTPGPGDIFSVPAGYVGAGSSGGPYGHVAYVAVRNEDGSILTEHYGENHYYQQTYTPEQVASFIQGGVVFKTNAANPVRNALGAGVTSQLYSPQDARDYARSRLADFGWDESEMVALTRLWEGESGWRWNAENPSSGAYGIPQALPAEKMASAGEDWRSNPATQIDWGLQYIKDTYGSPSAALEFWNSNDPHWY